MEGYGRRRYKSDFIKYLVYAHASRDETLLNLHFLQETHADIDLNELKDLYQCYDPLGAQINTFIFYVEEEWR